MSRIDIHVSKRRSFFVSNGSLAETEQATEVVVSVGYTRGAEEFERKYSNDSLPSVESAILWLDKLYEGDMLNIDADDFDTIVEVVKLSFSKLT